MSIHILAIDTSTEACSVAIWRDGKIFNKFIFSPRMHTHKILPMIEQCFIDSNLNLQHINVLAFGRGPGSFTGVRISVGIIKGLAFGANLPIISISSLLIIAQGAYRQLGEKKIIVAMDAKMGDIYSACYELKSNGYWSGEETEKVLKPEQFLNKINNLNGKWITVGTGWKIYPILKMTNLHLLESIICLPDAQDILPLALQAWQDGKIINAEEAHPVYLHNKIYWKKLPNK
ncbi:MAG: tRNA (adenosine(37)-N6)-threonylcarbamoyltransferase complex dimerization subunit type 1 TsaB [Arsenophonus endosymbiont of Ceratovacuna japonica]